MYSSVRLWAVVSLLLLTTFTLQARIIHYNNDPSPKEQYLAGLLKLALTKSEGSFQVEPHADVLTGGKARAELLAGALDVYWMPAVQETEERFRPIRIPLVKGLLGHRLMIIRKGEQHRFDGVDDLKELKHFIAGQGRFWGDTQILKAAGIPLETSMKYRNLFFMLEGERFDYFPRAAHEPWSEVKAYPELELEVEKNILLIYPLAMYLCVRKDDTELAFAIERGLEAAIADGSFDDYFYSHPLIRSALGESNLRDRRVIRLDNPFLPESTPLERKELWLSLENLPEL